jgi:glutaminyl-peptide cyclotransferase
MRQLTRWFSSLAAITALIAIVACTKPSPPPFKPPRFDQDRAYRRLQELCAFGPRNHDSEGKVKAEDWIQKALRDAGAEVTVHSFVHTPQGTNQRLSFRNIVGRIGVNQTQRVMIATHYDTRATADKDADETKRSQPIIGANDGGSGVAVLLEMAALWKEQPPPVGVDLIFFDGEDFGRGQEWDDYFLGSKAWVRDFPEYRPEWGVVLDMVGDGDLRIAREKDSLLRAPSTVERLWNAATRVGSQDIVDERGGLVHDDHTAFLDQGIPVILLIDFKYPWFHTAGDTPDKCAPDSLGQVGRAVMEAVEAP